MQTSFMAGLSNAACLRLTFAPSFCNLCGFAKLSIANLFVGCHRGAPLPSIAQWISGLFGSVDLAPSDITAALVLAAAAQRRRRKNRIKRALNPIIKAASNAPSYQTSEHLSETTASADDRECACLRDMLTCEKIAKRGAALFDEGVVDFSSKSQSYRPLPCNSHHSLACSFDLRTCVCAGV